MRIDPRQMEYQTDSYPRCSVLISLVVVVHETACWRVEGRGAAYLLIPHFTNSSMSLITYMRGRLVVIICCDVMGPNNPCDSM